MAKRTKVQKVDNGAPLEFETSSGVTIKIKPVSRFLIDSLLASKPIINPPTYKITTAAGNEEVFFHDDKSIETASEEEKSAYKNSLLAQREADNTYNVNFFNLMMLYGADTKVPEDDTWIRRQKKVGILIPEDPDELFLHYLQTEIFVIEEDATDFVVAVLSASGASKEAAEQLQKSFRAAIQEARDQRNTIIVKKSMGSRIPVD